MAEKVEIGIQTDDELRTMSMIDVEEYMADMYDNNENNNSTICDVISIYLKGQKILYTEVGNQGSPTTPPYTGKLLKNYLQNISNVSIKYHQY